MGPWAWLRYLENVYPELALPNGGDRPNQSGHLIPNVTARPLRPWYNRTRDYTGAFRLQLKKTQLCAHAQKGYKSRGGRLVLRKCSDDDENQVSLTGRGRVSGVDTGITGLQSGVCFELTQMQ